MSDAAHDVARQVPNEAPHVSHKLQDTPSQGLWVLLRLTKGSAAHDVQREVADEAPHLHRLSALGCFSQALHKHLVHPYTDLSKPTPLHEGVEYYRQGSQVPSACLPCTPLWFTAGMSCAHLGAGVHALRVVLQAAREEDLPHR